MEASLTSLRERIVAAHHAKTPLRLIGGGSKDFYGETLLGDPLDTRTHTGIVDYEPSELVITARCGTPLSEIEHALAQQNQFLAFEPPAFGGAATIGGVIAAGLSGPRRACVGGARDFVLGAHLLDAHGDLMRFGGQVMKNVAGFDVSRLLCGSLGILGLISQVSLKVMPLPRAEITLSFELTAAQTLHKWDQYRAQPLPISASSWHAGAMHLRLSGSHNALNSARALLGGECLPAADAQKLWRDLRDQSHQLFRDVTTRLWRLSLPAAAKLFDRGTATTTQLMEWNGALRWCHSDASSTQMRDEAEKHGGTAMLWRGARETTMFHPLVPANQALHQRLKQQFDPHGIFNRSRLSLEF